MDPRLRGGDVRELLHRHARREYPRA